MHRRPRCLAPSSNVSLSPAFRRYPSRRRLTSMPLSPLALKQIPRSGHPSQRGHSLGHGHRVAAAYILDKFADLSAVAVCAAGAVAFVALYALTLRVYARRAAKRGDD